MATSEHDVQVLQALRQAREQHQELADLLDFYHDLYEVQFQAKVQVPELEIRDELAKRWRLEGGIPQVTFDQLGIEPEFFARLVSRVTEVLVKHNPAWQMEGGTGDSLELVAQARDLFETWDTLTAPRAGAGAGGSDETLRDPPRALAVGFALAPYLQRAADVILPQLDLALWLQPYCPICGGRPNLALLAQEQGARQLLCSRCNGQWGYQRIGCPFCKSAEKQTYYLSEDGVYRLYVCPACKQYLKTIDLRELARPVQPVVERLLMVGMDLAARQEGYGG